MPGKRSDLETFDGLDNRREIMVLLDRLGSDEERVKFLESLVPSSLKGFANAPVKVQGACDPVTAYFMFIGVVNELGVPINVAAKRLEAAVRKVQR